MRRRRSADQAQTANELDRVARDLDKAINLSRDPREAVKQLARLEEDLKNRVQKEIDKKDAEQPLGERMRALAREQKAIQKAVEQISVTPNDQGRTDRKNAATKAEQAAQSLERLESREAMSRMEQTRFALEVMAHNMPKLDQRQQQALREVSQLKQKQEEIARDTQQAQQQAANSP